MDIVLIIGFVILFLAGIYFLWNSETEEEKEAARRLKESLEDDRIFHPETGVYISLEEAESGVWSTDDRETHYMPTLQLAKEHESLEVTLKYLHETDFYTKTGDLPEVEYDIVESCKILSKYDEWWYSYTFTFANGLLFFPVVDRGIDGSLLMFLVKIPSLKGHYYLREKEFGEKLFDMIRKDDDLSLKDYESFTFRRSKNIEAIHTFLSVFENEKGLEIEINDTFLLIKTLKLANMDDLLRIERIVKKIQS